MGRAGHVVSLIPLRQLRWAERHTPCITRHRWATTECSLENEVWSTSLPRFRLKGFSVKMQKRFIAVETTGVFSFFLGENERFPTSGFACPNVSKVELNSWTLYVQNSSDKRTGANDKNLSNPYAC